MPFVSLTLAAAAIATAFELSAFWTAVITLAASAAGSYLRQRANRPKPGTPDPRLIQVTTAETQPKRFIFGQQKVGAWLVDAHARITSGATGSSTGEKWFAMVLVYADAPLDSSGRPIRPLEGVQDIWLDGIPMYLSPRGSYRNRLQVWRAPDQVVNLADGDNVDYNLYRHRVYLLDFPTGEGYYKETQFLRGSDAIFDIVEFSKVDAVGNIKSDARPNFLDTDLYKGTAFCILFLRAPNVPHLDVGQKSPWRGVPSVELLVKGMKLTWPGQNTPTWTDNAKVISAQHPSVVR